MTTAVRGSAIRKKTTLTKACVALVLGGDSSERDVSLETGRAVFETLRGAGVNVFPFDPSESRMGEMLRRNPTTVFLAMHGKGGEDGVIQAKLDELGVRYTGSGPVASARAMDKVETKKRFCATGIPTPPYRVIVREDLPRAEEICAGLGYPVVVKPACEGSSIGITMADTRFGLFEGLDKAFRFGDRAVVEKRIIGKEFCIGILGKKTLPAVQVVYADDFFTYRAKYSDPRTAYIFDHGAPSRVVRSMEQVSLASFEALGCRHLARVDLIVSHDDQTPYVLEVNTLPGMTSHSLLPKAALQCGISFTDLCLRILELAGETVMP